MRSRIPEPGAALGALIGLRRPPQSQETREQLKLVPAHDLAGDLLSQGGQGLCSPRCTHLRKGAGRPSVPAAPRARPFLRTPTCVCVCGGVSLPRGDPGSPAPLATP